jgi:hypothetical protein
MKDIKPQGYWTYEKCKEEALKYTKMNDFKFKSPGAYNSSHKNKWIKEISQHMILNKKPTSYWNYENCKNEALKYINRNSFRKESNGAYESARKNNWLDEICGHMKQFKKPNGYWTYENCKEEALKYETISSFAHTSKSAYSISIKNKWINDICSHMKLQITSYGYWTYENCKEEALKYNNRTVFQKSKPGAYHSARKHNWLNEICNHMT